MRLTPLALLLVLAVASPMATAEVVDVPAAGTAPSPASLPRKGETMPVVLHRFGPPAQKHAPVGGDAPKHPPITRWDYPGFSVFFERNHVVDAVVPGAPTPIYHTEKLSPAG